MTERALVFVAVVVVAWPMTAAVASAAPCPPDARRGVPVRVPRGPGDLAMLPEACGANEVTFFARGSLALDLDDFYGAIDGAVGVRGRVALSRRVWISFGLPALEARFAANATVEAASFDLGAGTLAAHMALDVGARLRVAPYFRLLVPTETTFTTGTRMGYEVGAAVAGRVARRLEIVGGALAASSFVVLDDRQRSVVSLAVVADVVWHTARWLTLVLGAAVRAVPADPEPLEAVEPRAEARLHLGRWAITLGGEVPLAGRDRTDARIVASVGRAL